MLRCCVKAMRALRSSRAVRPSKHAWPFSATPSKSSCSTAGRLQCWHPPAVSPSKPGQASESNAPAYAPSCAMLQSGFCTSASKRFVSGGEHRVLGAAGPRAHPGRSQEGGGRLRIAVGVVRLVIAVAAGGRTGGALLAARLATDVRHSAGGSALRFAASGLHLSLSLSASGGAGLHCAQMLMVTHQALQQTQLPKLQATAQLKYAILPTM